MSNSRTTPRLRLSRLGENLVQSASGTQTVGESGERVVICKAGDFPLRAPQLISCTNPLRDIGLDANPAAQLCVRIEERTCIRVEPSFPTVLPRAARRTTL